jgi:predicted amidohydrolase YtcJ
VNCHANGDVAIDMYLTAIERAQQAFPRPDARPKITHCTLITEDLVRRIKALDAIPAMFTTYAYYNSDKFPFYGEELMKRSMAYHMATVYWQPTPCSWIRADTVSSSSSTRAMANLYFVNRLSPT